MGVALMSGFLSDLGKQRQLSLLLLPTAHCPLPTE